MNLVKLTPQVGIYAGTFDPITNGHLDVIKAGSGILEELIVAVGINPEKKTLFTLEERIELIKDATSAISNVKVDSFRGLIADFAKQQKSGVLLRGLRTETDFIYEMQMAMMNRHLAPDIQTIFVPTRQDQSHISSSLVKEVSKLGGDVKSLVSGAVYEALSEKYSKS